MSNQGTPQIYGGQAVIEGVMFAGRKVNVTAVRRRNQEIEFYEVPKHSRSWVEKLKKLPLVRGVVGIVEASAKGSAHLNFAMDRYADDMEAADAEKKGIVLEKKQKPQGKWDLSMMIGVAAAGVISFIFGKAMLTAAPAVVEEWLFGDLFEGVILHNIIEGIIKLLFLLTYLYLLSLTPLVKRLFQYHGAEHKVITAYEHGVELTIENVQKFTRLHYRCGSSFIVLSVIVGVFIYSFFTWDSIWERVYIRLLFLPVVLGVSYEVLRFTNALRDVPILRYLGYPGLWLQLLTTKEPLDEHVEVSIASFKRMLELDEVLHAKELGTYAEQT